MTIRHPAHLSQQVRGAIGQRPEVGLSAFGLLLSRDSGCESAQANVGNDRKKESSDNDLQGINEFRHDKLVNDIESHREKKYLTDTFPSVLDEVVA
jgi:hypothetical protein